MSKVMVIGGGMVGSAMAIDMSKKHEITVADNSRDALDKVKKRSDKIDTVQLDVRDTNAFQNLLKDRDLVISAVPGFLGYKTLKTIIESKTDVVDISFFPEDALSLASLANENDVTAIVDCGVAPGMGNIILGYHNEKMKVTDFECLVGGLPKIKKWPFQYKAPFSPTDVIEEYTRPARYVQNGQEIVREPLSDCRLVEFERIGTLESFNSDGLRSVIQTMSHIPNMKEKTLRYPGHAEYISVLKHSGFFKEDSIEINGQQISPMDFTAKILFKEWKLGEHEEEFTVMRITIQGENSDGKKVKIVYNLYDELDNKTNTSSMARTTGYTATAAANMVLDGLFSEKGVFPPELFGKEEACFNYILSYLKERNIHYTKNIVTGN
jgi:lysine 6-dehydrogenase